MKSRTQPRPTPYTLAISPRAHMPSFQPPMVVQSGRSSSFFGRQLPVPRLQDRKRRPPARAPSGHCSNFYSPPPAPHHLVRRRSQAACRQPCISIFRHLSSLADLTIWRLAALEGMPAPDAAAMVDVAAAVTRVGEDDNRWETA